ncbi:MAG: alpha/beta hydrolase-fold protein [Bdellovibrionota bacterium]
MKKTILILGTVFCSLTAIATESVEQPQVTDELIDRMTINDDGPQSNKSTKAVYTTPDNAVCSGSKFEGVDVKWCIHFADRTKNPQVLYHFHGLGGNEKKWGNNYTKQLISYWKDQGLTAPTVVTVSFGKLWLLTQTSFGSRRYEMFIKKMMPFFEAKLGLPVDASQRMLLGESMGGFNTTQVMLKNPELFSRFALHCPAVTPIGPFDSETTTKDFIKFTNAIAIRVWFTKAVGMLNFLKKSVWREHDPLLLSAAATSIPAKVYLSCGDNDEFGFDTGTDALVKNLTNKVQQMEYVFIPGGTHGTVDVKSLADFLSADFPR